MRLFLVVLIISGIFQETYGQSYHKFIRPNTFWDTHLTIPATICGFVDGSRVFYDGDTTISGTNYSIISSYPIESVVVNPYCSPYYVDNTNKQFVTYINEDTVNQRVYIYGHSFADTLLYDFSLNTGDTLFSEYLAQGNSVPYFIIDTTGIVQLADSTFRKILYVTTSTGQEHFIEGIGGSQGPFTQLMRAIHAFNLMVCHSDNNVYLWGYNSGVGSNNSCYGLVGLDENSILKMVKVYPNPASGLIFIENRSQQPLQFELYDQLGKLVLQTKVTGANESISIEHYDPGLYYYNISSENGLSRADKLIIQN